MCLAVPIQIKAIHPDGNATVELGGVSREVSLVMTPEAMIGDYVLIHAGFAISVLDQEEAQETLRLLREIDDPSCPADGGDRA